LPLPLIPVSTRSRFRLLLALVLIVVVVALLWLVLAKAKPESSGGQPRPAANNLTPVVVAKAAPTTDDVTLGVVGSALASSSVTLFPATAGEVDKVLFVAGDRVKKGQLLVQLVDRSEHLAVQSAAAQLDAADRLLKRYQRTKGSGAVSATIIDEAQIARRQAEIALGQAREQLRDRAVEAPFSGVVGIAQVDPGDRVASDTPLTTLDDRTLLSVSFQVPEPFLARLKPGHAVTLSNVAFPERQFKGKLAHIDSRIDPVTRTVQVRAAVPNPDDLLRPGMSFNIKLNLPGEPVMQVPELAVQWSRDGSYVWAVRENTSVRVPVRVIRRIEGAVFVDGELRAGDPIVVEGVQRLRPGRAVRVVQQDGATEVPSTAGTS
jgi:membrane fusion protein (multidrug efflux system)